MTNQRPERASTLSNAVYPRGDPIFKSKITFILVTWFIQPNDHMNHVTEYQVAYCLDCSNKAKIFFDLNLKIRKWLLEKIIFDPKNYWVNLTYFWSTFRPFECQERNKVFDKNKNVENGIKLTQNIEDFFEWSHDETYYCSTFIHIENQV